MTFVAVLGILAALMSTSVAGAGKTVATSYQPVKAVFDFYLDDPQKIDSALYWMRSVMNPLMDAPYDYPLEDLNIIVVIHGTESSPSPPKMKLNTAMWSSVCVTTPAWG